MQLVGYTSQMSVRAGDTLSAHISCAEDTYTASVVHLQHGDINPKGPGFKAETVVSDIDGIYDGKWHDVPAGSYGFIENAGDLLNASACTIVVWICPTAPVRGEQVVLARDIDGFCLSINHWGFPKISIGSQELTGLYSLSRMQWYLLVVRFDRQSGELEFHSVPKRVWPGRSEPFVVRTTFGNLKKWGGPLLFAARPTETGVANHFNGKIDTPCIFDEWLSDGLLEELQLDKAIEPHKITWDFSIDHAALEVPDSTGKYVAKLINMPTRAVTGHRWNGEVDKPAEKPAHYTAIHFHDDDRDNAGWPESFRLSIPADWRSGIYAFYLHTDSGAEDYIPFFVLPRNKPTEKIAFLAPTFSYLAYGNAHYTNLPDSPSCPGELDGYTPEQIQDQYVLQQKLNSCYDHHSDGSGVCYVSRLLPHPHIRPKVFFNNFEGPHQLNADLYIVDWLHVKGFPHDILTDEVLHHEGVKLLSPYQVVITGTHPEYWSGDMLDSLQLYLDAGGRVMYLGGNGFYWVTSVHPNAPHVLEIRKAHGTHTWSAYPGELCHASTGERGGLWRHRGRAPQKMLGVGMAGEGIGGANSAYRRTEASHLEPVAYMFDGITGDMIGDTPSLVQSWGAAGFEVDRIDFALGSPPNTICIAQSCKLGEEYQLATEDILASMLTNIGPENPMLRSDIAYLEYPGGGAVFSVGSISYSGCLSYNNYDNAVSRLTENVLRKFSR